MYPAAYGGGRAAKVTPFAASPRGSWQDARPRVFICSRNVNQLTRSRFSNDHVFELPRIALVERLLEQPLAIEQRRPVAVRAGDRSEIRHADLEVAAEIQLVRLDHATIRI